MSRFAKKMHVSPVRRFMLNLYGDPTADPSVGGGAEIEATQLLAFLERVNEGRSARITITHVLVKIIADSLREYPELNVKVVGRRIYQLKHVDIRLAVNLFPSGKDSPEVFMFMVKDADRKSLSEIAQDCAEAADWSRRTGSQKTLSGKLLPLTKYIPDPIFNLAAQVGIRIATSGRLVAHGIARDPMGSTAVTNVGPFGLPEGVGAVQPVGLLPPFGYASLVVGMPIQEKPLAVDGKVEVRPMLPLGIAVDHRAIDGFKVFRYMRYWTKALRNPDDYFEGKL